MCLWRSSRSFGHLPEVCTKPIDVVNAVIALRASRSGQFSSISFKSSSGQSRSKTNFCPASPTVLFLWSSCSSSSSLSLNGPMLMCPRNSVGEMDEHCSGWEDIWATSPSVPLVGLSWLPIYTWEILCYSSNIWHVIFHQRRLRIPEPNTYVNRKSFKWATWRSSKRPLACVVQKIKKSCQIFDFILTQHDIN